MKKKQDNFTMQDWDNLLERNKIFSDYYDESTLPKDCFTVLHYSNKYNIPLAKASDEIEKLIRLGKITRFGWYKVFGDQIRYRVYKVNDKEKI